MTLRELLEQIAQHKLNPDAEIVFINGNLDEEQFTEGIMYCDDYSIHFG